MSGFNTRAIHAGQEPDALTGAVTVPIYATSTYKQDGVGGLRGGYEYSRGANPTRTALEEALAALEGGRRGLAFASGMAAEDTLLRAICRPGDHVLLPDDAYGGTFRLVARVLARWGIEYTTVPLVDVDAVRAAVRPTTRVLWAETPTNPLLGIADIAALASVAAEAGARLVVDNTFASPYLQQPIALGADVVVHSTTKYLGGHSDVIGGALVTADADLGDQLAFHQMSMGAVAGPFDAWLVLRGIKTLGVRMDRHCANAARIAEFLLGHRAVARVLYPGLADHPGHDARGPSDARLRRHGVVHAARWRGGRAQGVRTCVNVHARRVTRRRRVADRAPGPDDARIGCRLAAGGAGRPRPALGRYRGRRRPDRRSRRRPQLTSRTETPGNAARASRPSVVSRVSSSSDAHAT